MKNTYSHKYSRSTDAKDDKIKIFHHDIYLGNNNKNISIPTFSYIGYIYKN